MFYISSHGHAASGWIAKVLSIHPKITCWHGTRSIPPFQSGMSRDLSEKEFVEGLIQCEKATFKQKIFGACHGFHGIKLYEQIKKNNGIFLALVRNPLQRTHSHLCSRLAYDISGEKFSGNHKFDLEKFFKNYENLINENFAEVINQINLKKQKRQNFLNFLNFLKKIKVHKPLKLTNNKIKQFKKIYSKTTKNRIVVKDNYIDYKIDFEKFISNLEPKIIANRSILCFIENCEKVFKPDEEIFITDGNDNFIKMEEMTKSKDYFNKKILNKILKEDGDNNYFENIFKTQQENKHSFKKDTPEYIFELWPKTFRDYFSKRYKGSSAQNLYKDMGYEIEKVI